MSELTVPGTVLATAVHLAYIVILDGGVKDPPDAIGPYVESPDGVSLYPANVNPVLVPGEGAVCATPAFCVVDPPPVPPLAFHVTVY